jgi:hypothetical protein
MLTYSFLFGGALIGKTPYGGKHFYALKRRNF